MGLSLTITQSILAELTSKGEVMVCHAIRFEEAVNVVR